MHQQLCYNIPLRIASDTPQEFRYEIAETFFEQYSNGEIKGGNLTASVSLQKKNSAYLLHISIVGYVLVTCDRCLDLCKQAVDISEEITANVSEETLFDPGTTNICVSGQDTELNISDLLHELMVVSLPVKRIHLPKVFGEDCNPEMINILNKYITVDEETSTDSRWDKLKELKSNT